MADKSDVFFGDDPFQIFKRWFKDASKTHIPFGNLQNWEIQSQLKLLKT